MTLTITDRIRAAKDIAELRDILRHTTPEEDELIDFAGLPSWGDDPRLCGADSRPDDASCWSWQQMTADTWLVLDINEGRWSIYKYTAQA